MSIKHTKVTAFSRLKNTFRARQIFVRSNGEVRFVTLGTIPQIVLTAGALGTAAWITYSSFVVANTQEIIQAKDDRNQQVIAKYEGRLAQMLRSIESINSRLMADQDAYINKVTKLENTLKALEQRHKTLKKAMKKELGPKLSKSQPKHRERQSFLSGEKFKTHAEAERPVTEIRDRLKDLDSGQREFLDAYEQGQKRKIKAIARSIRRLGLRPRRVLSSTKRSNKSSAMGGPFLAAAPPDEAARKLNSQYERIDRLLAEIELYRTAVAAMPVGRPLPSWRRMTSGFGMRRDPFRKIPAMHNGVDFRAPTGAPVKTTAAGRVVRAGTLGGYGKVVEVRHKHGVSTRYAHLSRISVKPGQKVKKNERIGRVGNTGRSTGPHLHYEIRVFGKAVNPIRFWRTGRDVLEKKNK